MVTALYYPHTEIQSPDLIKTALLLWDSIECIVPNNDYNFRPRYNEKRLNEAFELIAKKHVPNQEERIKAHQDVEILVRENGEEFIMSNPISRIYPDNYLIYPDKFLEMTWHNLERRGLANWDHLANDYGVPPALGLLMMSSLADACAGSQKQKVTDRTYAYSLLERAKAAKVGAPYVEGLDSSQITPELDKLVSISLNVLGAKNIPLKKLLSFRKKELKGSTTDYRTMRLNYMKALETYLARIVKECKSQNDLLEIERQFKEEIKTELNNLKQELNLTNIDALLSKELAASIMLIGGTFLEPISGITTLATSLKGIGIIPLIKTREKLKNDRRKALLKSNISWLYLSNQKFISLR